eukprot:3039359-Alexandrium_andersonii.AAC.1
MVLATFNTNGWRTRGQANLEWAREQGAHIALAQETQIGERSVPGFSGELRRSRHSSCIVPAHNARGGTPAWGLVTMTKEEHALTEVLRADGEDGQLLAVRAEFGGRAVL